MRSCHGEKGYSTVLGKYNNGEGCKVGSDTFGTFTRGVDVNMTVVYICCMRHVGPRREKAQRAPPGETLVVLESLPTISR